MKPPAFKYHAPASLAEALDALDAVGHDGKVLAGGQSLIPILNMRLAAPAHLVDINRLSELAYVRTEPGGVTVGALARHADVERDADAYAAVPLLRQGLRLVAHPVIRNRGTTVGSLAHADPSGEMTAVLALLGGSVDLVRKGASRTVGAEDFFAGPLESCIEPGEMAVSAYFPRLAGRTGTEFVEAARRHGDYAMCGVAAAVTLDDDLRVTRARAAYLSVSPVPLVLDLTEAVHGATPATARWADAAALAVLSIEPEPDIHATAEYRAHLARVLTERALRAAAQRATSTDVERTSR
ncbi:FAD binding domain-containing protein [Yinghuangia seranimata]|uniref:FAD binding domain-containing protein n=1 Tax=Yinghuangia seranimata TaxID=408067 RepID=UPI00248C14F0|nr:FAD binding domain-containing protein [Yinghuangia seranimata]MDI2124728.1 FAD binding domain-containing protein [Yinghuangia seranimata]